MKRNLLMQALVVLGLLFMISCEYEFIEYPEIIIPDPGDTTLPDISFQADVLPIFNEGNNCTSCHGTGATPDFTEANAYNSITSMGLVNTDDPQSSKLYDYVLQQTSTHSYNYYTPEESITILTWITQGAQNN